MIYKLSSSATDVLIQYPESGMGYQLIEANIKGMPVYEKESFWVFNGIYAVMIDDNEKKSLLEFANTSEEFLAKLPANIELQNIKVLNYHFLQNLMIKEPSKNNSAAVIGAKENANGDELFVRLSAFEDDIRIDREKKCLRPGSYTTMASDAIRCKIDKDDPRQRYALPGDLPILYVFYIQPLPVDVLQRGSVKPDFGKRDGGREAYFENGTSILTFILQTKW